MVRPLTPIRTLFTFLFAAPCVDAISSGALTALTVSVTVTIPSMTLSTYCHDGDESCKRNVVSNEQQLNSAADDESDDDDEDTVSNHMLLLQKTLSLDESYKAKPGSTHADEFIAYPMEIDNSVCFSFTPLNMQLGLETLRTLGYLPARPNCHNASQPIPLGLTQIVTMHQTPLLALMDRTSATVWFLMCYLGLYTLVVACMLRAVFLPTYDNAPKTGIFRPEAEAWKHGVMSWLSIQWATPWIWRWGMPLDSVSVKIKDQELGASGDAEDEPQQSYKVFKELWEADLERRGEGPINMYRVALRFCFKQKNIAIGVALSTCGFEVFMYLGPTFAVDWVLRYMSWMANERAQNPESVTLESQFAPIVAIVVLFTGMPLLMAVLNTISYMLSTRLNIRMVGALGAMVFRKAQRLPIGDEYDVSGITKEEQDKAERNGLGRITSKYNVVQIYTQDLNGSLTSLQTNAARAVTMIPIFIVLLVLLCVKIGLATFFAAAGALGSTVLTFSLMKYQVSTFRWCQAIGGARLTYMQESFFGIRVMKAYAWDEAIRKIITATRNDEMYHLWWYYFWNGIMYMMIFGYPRLMSICSLAGYVAIYKGMTAESIFMILQILNAFRGAFQSFTSMIPALVAVGPSVIRVDKFLKLKEAGIPGPKHESVQPWVSIWPKNRPACENAVRLQGSFTWPDCKETILKDIDMQVNAGELVAIVGEVGAGKTTLLFGLLGELVPLGDSHVEVGEKIALHGQVPTIIEGTLKENVLYWADYDETRYQKAISCACLRQDLEVLPGGDGVPIGSRGIVLSGGQRARVSMARAAYSQGTDVVLLDDPFSSVDRPTGKYLMNNLLKGPLMENKTRIVVCQPDRQRIMHFDRVYVIQEGRIMAQGTPQEIVNTSFYKHLLATNEEQPTAEDLVEEDTTLDKRPVNLQVDTVAVAKTNPNLQRIFREEEYEGRADWRTIKYYCAMGKWRNILGCIATFFVQTICNMLADVVLAKWSNAKVMEQIYGNAQAREMEGGHGAGYFLRGFTFWFGMSNVVYIFCWCFGMSWSLNISRTIHETILDRLLRAPVDRFFDKTPVGRIMNRLSSDLASIDFQTYIKLTASIGMIFWFSVPMFYIHTIMPLYFSVSCIPFYTLLFAMIRRYWNVMIPLRYLNSTTRSKVNIFLTETEYGNPSQRAYQIAEPVQIFQMQAMDQMLKADFASGSIRRWIINRVLVLYSFFCTLVGLLGILATSMVDVGAVSLCLTNIIMIIMQVEIYVDQATAAQFEFISMNRLHEYTEIVQERPDVLEGDQDYKSFLTCVIREDLGRLEMMEDSQGVKVVRILAGADTGPPGKFYRDKSTNRLNLIPKEVLLVTHPSGFGLVPPAGKTLAALDPSNKDFPTATAWHRITAVNGEFKDVRRMAERLCYGHSPHIILGVTSGWLADGAKVVISDLVCGYADIPVDVLKGINLTIERKCKLAIAGATGCGKSTLLLSMLRMIEPRAGKIEIEGVDTQMLGLHTLRKSVGLVPQDPVLFSGTIRKNMDPFQEHVDERLWLALKAVQLEHFVSSMEAGLDSQVRQDGDNISFGQRQLICISRMILRNPALLLLDEATSGIDPSTQERISDTLKSSFPDATIIAIAHRLETVLDFDIVVVMDKGHIVEKGPVKELQNMKGGIFNKMLAGKK